MKKKDTIKHKVVLMTDDDTTVKKATIEGALPGVITHEGQYFTFARNRGSDEKVKHIYRLAAHIEL
jgi:hypothetical protein